MNLIEADDHVQYRAGLARYVGGPLEAIIWERIRFRSNPLSRDSFEHEGLRWWSASYAKIAEETGMTAKQAKLAISRLVDREFLLEATFALDTAFNRTKSYSVVLRGPLDEPYRADGTALQGRFDEPYRANVPLIEEIEEERTRTRTRRKNPVTALPDGWVPAEAQVLFAAENGLDLEREVEKFKDNAEMRGHRYANWDTAFRVWLKNSRDMHTPQPPQATQW